MIITWHNRSTFWLVFKKNASGFGYLHPEMSGKNYFLLIYPERYLAKIKNKPNLLESSRFSVCAMHPNNVVFLKTMVAKQPNCITVADIEQIQSICSINPLSTWKMYTNCEAITLPYDKKPSSTRLLKVFDLSNWFDGLMPNIA